MARIGKGMVVVVGGVTLCVCVCVCLCVCVRMSGVEKRRFVEESERGGRPQRFRSGETSTYRMLPHFYLRENTKMMLSLTLCLHFPNPFKN